MIFEVCEKANTNEFQTDKSLSNAKDSVLTNVKAGGCTMKLWISDDVF